MEHRCRSRSKKRSVEKGGGPALVERTGLLPLGYVLMKTIDELAHVDFRSLTDSWVSTLAPGVSSKIRLADSKLRS